MYKIKLCDKIEATNQNYKYLNDVNSESDIARLILHWTTTTLNSRSRLLGNLLVFQISHRLASDNLPLIVAISVLQSLIRSLFERQPPL